MTVVLPAPVPKVPPVKLRPLTAVLIGDLKLYPIARSNLAWEAKLINATSSAESGEVVDEGWNDSL